MQAGNILEPPQSTISGNVTNSTGEPLAGVNIVVESKNIGTISDMDGTYNIQAGPNDKLLFSIVGFKAMKVPIDGRTVSRPIA